MAARLEKARLVDEAIRACELADLAIRAALSDQCGPVPTPGAHLLLYARQHLHPVIGPYSQCRAAQHELRVHGLHDEAA
jgi:hypothetical protein